MNEPLADAACLRLRSLLAALPEAEHSEAVQTIEAHIAACPDCEAAERSLIPLIARYRATEQPPLPDDLLQRLLDRMCLSSLDDHARAR